MQLPTDRPRTRRTSLRPPPARACAALLAAGVVVRSPEGLTVVMDAFRPAPSAANGGLAEDGDGPGLRPFVDGDRLSSLPANHGRRGPILRHVADRAFEAGRSYHESTVNDLLRAWTRDGDVDHVALRRYLVDSGLLARNHSTYWLVTPDRPADPDTATRRVRALGLN